MRATVASKTVLFDLITAPSLLTNRPGTLVADSWLGEHRRAA
jgi:hypothetical protein